MEHSLGDVHPALAARINWIQRVSAAYGLATTVTSGYRTYEEQRELYENRGTNPFPVAPPGCSTHEYGLAVDLVANPYRPEYQNWLGSLGRYLGLVWRREDPVHFQIVPWGWSACQGTRTLPGPQNLQPRRSSRASGGLFLLSGAGGLDFPRFLRTDPSTGLPSGRVAALR